MDWIGASLAFATTMLALSIVVTSTVETIHRVCRLREKGLQLLLAHFYDATLAQLVARVPGSSTGIRNQFLQTMTANRAPAGNAPFKLRPGAEPAGLSRIWNGHTLASLSLDDFMARLGDHEVGDAIARVATNVGPGAAETVIRDIAHKFDEFGRDASVYFEARARLLSVIVAFVLAWQGYVNPYLLFQTYLSNPQVTAAVNAKTPDLVRKLDESQKRNEGETPPPADAAKVTHGVDATRSAVPDTVGSLAELGVPVGWTKDRLKASDFERWGVLVYPIRWSANAATTIALLGLGGILVGLGGPFWRDLAMSITGLRGGAQTEKRKEQKRTGEVAGDGRIAAATERFITASRARGVVTGDVAAQDETDKPVG